MPDEVAIRPETSIPNCDRPISKDSGFSQNSSLSPSSMSSRVFLAQHDHTANNADELSFKKGDKIHLDLTGKSEKEWYYGELNGKRGLFPKNFTTELVELWRFEKEDFEIMSEEGLTRSSIGFGATASVHKVRIVLERLLNTGNFPRQMVEECIAFKKFKTGFGQKFDEPHDEQQAIEALKQEALIVAKFSHENIVQFLGYSIDQPFFGLAFEICHGGSLRKLCTSTIDKTRSMPLDVLVNWGGQIASGMEYLAKLGYVHRDLKADNVLVKQASCQCDFKIKQCSECNGTGLKYLQLKIADFGGTRKIATRSVMSTVAGTYAWLAPESFNRNSYTEHSDVWSYGVVLWEILYREEPYRGIMPVAVAHSVSKDELKLEIYKNCPKKWAQMMKKCWNIEPKRRPHFSEIVRHFDEYTEELKMMNGQILVPQILRTEVDDSYGTSLAPGSRARSFLSRYLSLKD